MGEHMLTLAAYLRPSYTVTFACPPGPQGDALLGRAAALGIAAEDIASASELERRLRAQPADLMHVHARIGREGHEGVYAARAAGVPLVVRSEHLPYLLTDAAQQEAYRKLWPLLDGLICVSHGVRASHVQAGVPAELASVVHNGIIARAGGQDRASLRERLGWAPEQQVVLTVGRFTEQKGYPLLLDAVAIVVAEHPHVQFAWAGEGPLWDDLADQVRSRGLEGAVHLLGQRADVPDLMAAADAFVLPSQFEGLPLVLLEAMAAGLPVIGTRVCGTSEAIDDGRTGWLVAPGDVASLALAIDEVLGNRELAAQRGAAGQAAVASYWNAERMAGDMLRVYERARQAAGSAAWLGALEYGAP
jgi:glycosyltransferase involved in cell wall biosynthesis